MRELKVHLVVGWFSGDTGVHHILCHTPARDSQLTNDRDLVTCNICNHFIKEYGDKYVIERGNAPRTLLSQAERLSAYRAKRNIELPRPYSRYDEAVPYRQEYPYVGCNASEFDKALTHARGLILTVCSCGKVGCDCTERSGGW